MKPQKTQCIKDILEFYIGNGKGVATAYLILEYPIQLVQIQCNVHFINCSSCKIRSNIFFNSYGNRGKISIIHVHLTLCIKHESTTNIIIGYDTIGRLYSSSNMSLSHAITSNNSFSYQSRHHLLYKYIHT